MSDLFDYFLDSIYQLPEDIFFIFLKQIVGFLGSAIFIFLFFILYPPPTVYGNIGISHIMLAGAFIAGVLAQIAVVGPKRAALSIIGVFIVIFWIFSAGSILNVNLYEKFLVFYVTTSFGDFILGPMRDDLSFDFLRKLFGLTKSYQLGSLIKFTFSLLIVFIACWLFINTMVISASTTGELEHPKYDPYGNVEHLYKGLSLKDQGEYSEALSELDIAVKFPLPSKQLELLAYEVRGECLVFLNRYDEALLEYDKALEMDPNDGFAYIGKGNIYVLLNRDTVAWGYYKFASSKFSASNNLAEQNIDLLEHNRKELSNRNPVIVKRVLYGYENPKALYSASYIH